MRFTAVLTLTAILLLAGAAGADEEAKKTLGAADGLAKQGHIEQACALYRLAIEQAGEDTEVAKTASLHLAQCLLQGDAAGARDVAKELLVKFDDDEKISAAARRVLEAVQQQERVHAKDLDALEKIERELKAKGLEGDALRERYEAARAAYLEAKAKQKQAEEQARLIELWKQSGIDEEEIRERLARVARDRASLEAARVELLRYREMAERARELLEESAGSAEMEKEWRDRRDRDVEAARREFVRLAEKLGIPAEEAKRFLAEHAGRGPAPDPLARMHDLENHVRELERQLTEILGKMDARLRAVERRVGHLPAAPEDEVTRAPEIPRIQAKVIAVTGEHDAVVLSVGRDDGVEEGFRFTIYRGHEYVGTVVVKEIGPDHAVGYSLKDLEKSPIRVGDLATTRF